jgi:hypothetical protein
MSAFPPLSITAIEAKKQQEQAITASPVSYMNDDCNCKMKGWWRGGRLAARHPRAAASDAYEGL